MKMNRILSVVGLLALGCAGSKDNQKSPDSQSSGESDTDSLSSSTEHSSGDGGNSDHSTSESSSGSSENASGGGSGGGEELSQCKALTVQPITEAMHVVLGLEGGKMEGAATVTAADDLNVTLNFDESGDVLMIQASAMPSTFVGVGDRLDVKMNHPEGEDVFVELRREDGSLLWLLMDGRVDDMVLAEMDLPLALELSVLCSEEGVSSTAEYYTYQNQLLVMSMVEGTPVELQAWQEQEVSLDGAQYMMSVRFAKEYGQVICSDCFDIPKPGRHINLQLLPLDLAEQL